VAITCEAEAEKNPAKRSYRIFLMNCPCCVTKAESNLARSSWIGDYNDPQTFLGMFNSGDGK
jgi:hypothetical protein